MDPELVEGRRENQHKRVEPDFVGIKALIVLNERNGLQPNRFGARFCQEGENEPERGERIAIQIQRKYKRYKLLI